MTVDSHVATSPKGDEKGTVPGAVALALGIVSIFFLALICSPAAIILGIIGLRGGLKTQNNAGTAMSAVGIVTALVGLATSPMFYLLLGGIGLSMGSH